VAGLRPEVEDRVEAGSPPGLDLASGRRLTRLQPAGS